MTDNVAPTPGEPAAVVAPVVAPVVPPVPVQVALPEPVAPAPQTVNKIDDTEVISYEPTGDAGLDVALSFLGNLGLAADHPAMAAASQGEFGLLKAQLATMGDKARGWEQMVALGEQAHSRATAATNAVAERVKATVVEVAGSPEQWNAIQLWAAANADPDERKEFNAMFKAGPVQARAAALMLQEAYNKAGGTVITPANPLQVNVGNSPGPAANGPLSKADYAAAVDKLHSQLGNRMDDSPEYKALQSRRAAYRS